VGYVNFFLKKIIPYSKANPCVLYFGVKLRKTKTLRIRYMWYRLYDGNPQQKIEILTQFQLELKKKKKKKKPQISSNNYQYLILIALIYTNSNLRMQDVKERLLVLGLDYCNNMLKKKKKKDYCNK
jgi:hypothetical protein